LRYYYYRDMLAKYLGESAEWVGMPVSLEGLFSHGPEELISLPLSLAYCAMAMIDEDIAEAYLRRMRECVFAEGRSLASVDAQVELAAEFPIDVEQFRSNLESDEVRSYLQGGVSLCRMYGVSAFPTLLMQYGSNGLLVSGYRDYETLRQAIAQVSEGDISLSDAEFSIAAVEEYMGRFDKVAAREIQTMFSLNDAQLANVMMDLATTGRYETQSCGNSYFVVTK